MIRFAQRSLADRTAFFAEVATRRNIERLIVEKDFWACFALRMLFQDEEFGQHLVFKGGTSLSKVFGIINRFSEDRRAILRRCEPKPFRLVCPSFRTFDEQTVEPLPLGNVKKGFGRAVKEAGIKRRVGLHSLRHSFAVTLARQNVPLTKISKALGHSSLKTTQIYLRFMPDEGADVTSWIPDLGK